MAQPDLFWGLTATGWTAIGSMAGAVSILTLVIFNIATLQAAIKGLRIQIEGIRFQVQGIVFSGCPVLILRQNINGSYSIINCGQGPALMAQWGYGRSVLDTKVLRRLDDNIIPAGDSRNIVLDMRTAKASGITLFAYSVTNDKFVTSISWPGESDERRVHFGIYDGEMPRELLDHG
jgi:hypothetical protein